MSKLHEALQEGLQEILDNYPNGREYDREELYLDVRHDISKLMIKLGIEPKTPVDVHMDDGQLVIRFGSFPNRN